MLFLSILFYYSAILATTSINACLLAYVQSQQATKMAESIISIIVFGNKFLRSIFNRYTKHNTTKITLTFLEWTKSIFELLNNFMHIRL